MMTRLHWFDMNITVKNMYCAPVRDVTGNRPVKSECKVVDARMIRVYAGEAVRSGGLMVAAVSGVLSMLNMSIGVCVDCSPCRC